MARPSPCGRIRGRGWTRGVCRVGEATGRRQRGISQGRLFYLVAASAGQRQALLQRSNAVRLLREALHNSFGRAAPSATRRDGPRRGSAVAFHREIRERGIVEPRPAGRSWRAGGSEPVPQQLLAGRARRGRGCGRRAGQRGRRRPRGGVDVPGRVRERGRGSRGRLRVPLLALQPHRVALALPPHAPRRAGRRSRNRRAYGDVRRAWRRSVRRQRHAGLPNSFRVPSSRGISPARSVPPARRLRRGPFRIVATPRGGRGVPLPLRVRRGCQRRGRGGRFEV
ncbi:hypothetical protein T484DRAFT_1938305 [Baffinella frigidus]|nr:hypothetical protein T484DRAFT_1938305 [Cryptophyta sp. CCMP2293]